MVYGLGEGLEVIGAVLKRLAFTVESERAEPTVCSQPAATAPPLDAAARLYALAASLLLSSVRLQLTTFR